MNPFWAAVLPYLIPSLISAIGLTIGYFLLRRTNRESNDTNAFDVVTNKLMELVKNADERIQKLEDEVKELKSKVAAKDEENSHLHHENSTLHDEIADVKAELAEVRRVSSSLDAYVGKLVAQWPPGFLVPEPDTPLSYGTQWTSEHSDRMST